MINIRKKNVVGVVYAFWISRIIIIKKKSRIINVIKQFIPKFGINVCVYVYMYWHFEKLRSIFKKYLASKLTWKRNAARN